MALTQQDKQLSSPRSSCVERACLASFDEAQQLRTGMIRHPGFSRNRSEPPVFLCEACGWAHVCDDGCRERIVDGASGDLVCPISGFCCGRLLTEEEVTFGWKARTRAGTIVVTRLPGVVPPVSGTCCGGLLMERRHQVLQQPGFRLKLSLLSKLIAVGCFPAGRGAEPWRQG